ncbi:DUF4809 family protein [Candidatus Enterococcus ferrettii]|uniref:DUF4809 family protein n=1 Tax=Candidatus Enterococcus ferrettii TaxID=2815324 RepID=A0ABV0EKF2_9ENTE|nr:DUF4809 family protein [Enterococcus sp. 665A]MBO1341567.1 DUF4809 family protein [Enterococcus sp. 665A]
MQAVINQQEFITEGGCNACGFQSCVTYTLRLENEKTLLLDEYDNPSLITALALENGWRQEYVTIGIGEDALVFKKSDQQVEVHETGSMITYQKPGHRCSIPKCAAVKEEGFQQVNQVLLEIFSLEAYEFLEAVN